MSSLSVNSFKYRKSEAIDSLSVLTKKFINLIKNSEQSSINLNEAVSILKVQKHRIDDVTNVLEAINYAEKYYHWVGSNKDR